MDRNHRLFPKMRLNPVMNQAKASLRNVLGVFCLLFFSSCAALKAPDIWINTVTITVDEDANNFSATKVDVVILYHEGLMKKMMQMKAQDYFKNSDQLRIDNPGMLQVFRWEVIPGQCIFDMPIVMAGLMPVGGIIYARYFSQGDHRIRIGKEEHLHIRLGKKQFSMEPRIKE